MTINWSQFTLAELRANSIKRFRRGGGSRPDVMLVEIEGEKAVLKDQNGADKWFSLIVGPILTWRECKALKKLDNVACIPVLLHRPDSRSFLMSYHESEQITSVNSETVDWPVFFEKLTHAIESVHSKGIAHNDLRNPTNTLITPQGEPILVDLVACFCQGQAWNYPNLWLFNKFCLVDQSAITKIKQKLAPHLLNNNDVVPEQIAGKVGMAAKQLGQWVRRISRKLFTD